MRVHKYTQQKIKEYEILMNLIDYLTEILQKIERPLSRVLIIQEINQITHFLQENYNHIQ